LDDEPLPWHAHQSTLERSVRLRADRRNPDSRRTPVATLFQLVLGLGKHVMIADNAALRRLHEGFALTRVAQFRDVGYKFGRRLDLVFTPRWLNTSGAPAYGDPHGAG
jgi:L-amino acid N-acyltransferase YncA